MRSVVSSAVCLLGLAGCDLAPAGARARGAGGGQLVVDWQGITRGGRLAIPAEARLCRETGVVELLAIRGDTGVGLALFPTDSSRLTTGAYPVVYAGTVEEPRPGANLALRWFDRVTLEVFEGLDGMVRIARVGEAISGTLEARMRGVETSDTVRVEGRFDRVPLAVSPAGCAVTLKRNRM